MEKLRIKVNTFDTNSKSFLLKHKRIRERFHNRVQSLMQLPKEIISEYTKYSFSEDYTNEMCLIKNNLNKNNNKETLEKLEKNSPENNSESNYNYQANIVKEEIDEIINELELFAIQNRKIRMIHLMEKISESIDENLFDVEELTDYYMLGNKIVNLENEHLETQKRKYQNNIKLCEYTNKLLLSDDEYFNKTNAIDNNKYTKNIHNNVHN